MHFACHEMGYDRKLRIPKELRHAALAARRSVGFRVWELAVSFLGRAEDAIAAKIGHGRMTNRSV